MDGSLVVIGMQFGDEGKGKVVDYLTKEADVVVRFNGGNNAGHTVKIGKQEFKQHLLPSGVFHARKRNLISSGVVINPKVLLQEIETLRKKGISVSPKNLGIDYRAHIIMPWHILQEGGENSKQIGTTQRGIGPCYEDKVARTGIRFEDLQSSLILSNKIKQEYERKIRLLEHLHIYFPADFTFAGILSEYLAYSRVLKEYAVDVSEELSIALERKKRLLFEGAQGHYLDNNFGTYPYVTSSNSTSAAAALTSGLPPSSLKRVEGVVKAYATRVGNGPFPTELQGELADKIRMNGKEFGTTTGRPRRIGWLDLPMLRTAIRVNGITGLHLTKMDVLAGLKELKIATHYKIGRKQIEYFPTSADQLEQIKPVYKTFRGFAQENWRAVARKGKTQHLKALSRNAKIYINFIKSALKMPLMSVSVGPERDEIIRG